MSIDGPGITESDLGHDVYNEILDMYDAGARISDIRARLREFEDTLADELDREIYLAASARALWEIGHLDESIGQGLADLVRSGASSALWQETGDLELAKARATVLSRLLRQIKAPRQKPRARKKHAKVRRKLFLAGDCVELSTESRTYRGVVCTIREYRGDCEYAILVMVPETESTAESFASSAYFGRRIRTPEGRTAGPHVICPEHRMLIRERNPFLVVGHLELNPESFILGSFGGVLDMNDVFADFARTIEQAAVFGNQRLPLAELFPKDIAVAF